MSIQQMKKELLELKKAAAIENKQSEDYRLKNMTDDELQAEIDKELHNMGFQSEDEFYGAAKEYFAEHGLKTDFYSDYGVYDYLFEQPEEVVTDFILTNGNMGVPE